jgi:Uncharacterized conserved protein (DUF2190)
MAVDINLLKFSGMVAEQDMSGTGFQHRFMKGGSTATQFNRCTAAGDAPLGVLCNRPKLGKAGTIAFSGVKKVVAGGAVTVYADVHTDTQGRAVMVGAGMTRSGKALDAATAAGQLIRVELALGTRGYV